jgi:hypothetical protein
MDAPIKLTDWHRESATRYVHRRALDATDAQVLLAMLGLCNSATVSDHTEVQEMS